VTAPIRILIVDDSVVIRKLLTTILGETPGMEIVGTAPLGKIALTKIPQCQPDIVILDVEMPEMDGIETLKRIRKDAPGLPVIMFSTKTERGAAATIEALTSGASDYVAKPSNVGNVLLAMARIREEMVPKILALTAARRAPVRPRPGLATLPPALHASTSQIAISSLPPMSASRTASPTAPPPISALPKITTTSPIPIDAPIRLYRPTGPRPPVEIVAIGASTGGPNALGVLLGQLPTEFPVPIVIVQHMLATFTRHFAERLASQCRMPIVEASAGDPLLPGHAYIARGDHHLLVERRQGRVQLALNQEQVENFCRPAVDVLFRSVAYTYGAGALAVVLTGMGHDGLRGSSAIREAGGDIIVQDEASSVVWGMPGFIARAGIASEVLPLERLGIEVRRRVTLGPARALGGTP
jgi:two-component system chemotaxis response regulator CheB